MCRVITVINYNCAVHGEKAYRERKFNEMKSDP